MVCRPYGTRSGIARQPHHFRGGLMNAAPAALMITAATADNKAPIPTCQHGNKIDISREATTFISPSRHQPQHASTATRLTSVAKRRHSSARHGTTSTCQHENKIDIIREATTFISPSRHDLNVPAREQD